MAWKPCGGRQESLHQDPHRVPNSEIKHWAEPTRKPAGAKARPFRSGQPPAPVPPELPGPPTTSWSPSALPCKGAPEGSARGSDPGRAAAGIWSELGLGGLAGGSVSSSRPAPLRFPGAARGTEHRSAAAGRLGVRGGSSASSRDVGVSGEAAVCVSLACCPVQAESWKPAASMCRCVILCLGL